MNRSGTKTAISDALIDTTVKPICRAPSTAAAIDPMPASMLRVTFSIMTMASSTTKPTEIVMAIRDRLSSEKPENHIMSTVPASDSGTATPAASVGVRRRRNSSTTPITRATVISSVIWMSRTLARMVVVRSLSTDTSTPAGIHCRRAGSCAFTRSTVSITLASGCLVTISRTDGCLLYQPAARRVRTPRFTSATSPRRTIVPPLLLTTIPA